MRTRLFTLVGVAALVLGAVVVFTLVPMTGAGQAPDGSEGAANTTRTPWGEPDLQGIWTNEFDTPLQRPAQFADKEFFTDEERAELDKQRAALLGRDRRVERGSEHDVAGAYNARLPVGASRPAGARRSSSIRRTGEFRRLTPEAQQRAAADREFRLALLQATETCKNKSAALRRRQVRSDAVAAARRAATALQHRRASIAPTVRRMAASASAAWRGGCPTSAAYGGSFRRIVQSPGGDLDLLRHRPGPGVAAHHRHERQPAPAGARPPVVGRLARPLGGRHAGRRRHQLHARRPTSRARARTCTSSSAGRAGTRTRSSTPSRSRIRRRGRRPWTVKQEFTRQNEQANRIYYEPRCHEGNYGMPALLLAARARRSALRRGPRPASGDARTARPTSAGSQADPLGR